MSNPKLNIKEETSTKKTRSPPKKTRVEQSVPKKKIGSKGISSSVTQPCYYHESFNSRFWKINTQQVQYTIS